MDCTVSVKLATPGRTAYRYNFTNTSTLYPGFADNTITGLALTAGNVEVLKILP